MVGGKEQGGTLQSLASEALNCFVQTDEGCWLVAAPEETEPSWFPGLLYAVTSSGGAKVLNSAMSRALVVALKDLAASRRVYTSIGHTARGYLIALEENGIRNERRGEGKGTCLTRGSLTSAKTRT